MATLKQRLHRNSDNGYDTIHLETDATVVHMSPTDVTTVAATIDSLSTRIETIETKVIVTTSTKNIWVSAPGVTGSTVFTATKDDIVINSTYVAALEKWKLELPSYNYAGTWSVSGTYSGNTAFDDVVVSDDSNDYFVTLNFIPISGTLAVGNTVTYDNRSWLVVHHVNKLWYLALSEIWQNTAFGSSNTYNGSTIATLCTTWMNNYISSNAQQFMQNVTVQGVTNKVFIPTYDQCNSDFEYYNGNASHRICKYNGSNATWWTSSPSSSGGVYYVRSDGSILNFSNFPSSSFGFRPHICISY